MLSKKTLFTVLVVSMCLPYKSACQVPVLPETPKNLVIPMTPEAALFSKYGNIQINNAKGLLEIPIPLYDIELGDFKLPLGLNYASSGISVTDPTGILGANWRLSAGGMVYRSINGRADESNVGWFGCTGCYFDNTRIGLMWANPDLYQSDLASYGLNDEDTAPDLFGFSLGEFSGNFYFNRNGEIITNSSAPFKINHSVLTDTEGQKYLTFLIIDGKGNQYFFGESESSRETDELIAKSQGNTIEFRSGEGNTGWKLTKVITYKSDTITFNYNNYTFQHTYIASDQFSQYRIESSLFTLEPTSPPVTHPNFQRIINEHVYKCSLISSIETPVAGITFTYGAINNIYGWDRPLESILIRDDSDTLIKKFVFSISKTDAGQLFLNQIVEYGGDNYSVLSDGYRFKYNLSAFDMVGSMGRDYFGFSNGSDNNYTLLACPDGKSFGGNRRIDEGRVGHGTLSWIKYPTGGSTSFEYESNKEGSTYAGGVRIFRIIDYKNNNLVDPEEELIGPQNKREFFYEELTGSNLITQTTSSSYGYIKYFNIGLNTGTEYVVYSDNPDAKYLEATDFYYKKVSEIRYDGDTAIQRIISSYNSTFNGGSYNPLLEDEWYDGNISRSSSPYDWFTTRKAHQVFSNNNVISYPYYILNDSYYREIATPFGTYYPGLEPKSIRISKPRLVYRKEIEYFQNEDSIRKDMTVFYNQYGLITQRKDEIFSEEGVSNSSIQKIVKYPNDCSTSVYQNMVSSNMVDFPVEIVGVQDGNVTENKLITYKSTCGTYLPDAVYSGYPFTPLSSYGFYTGISITPNYSEPADIKFDTYAFKGVPVKVITKDGITNLYYWDSKGQYLRANIKSGKPLFYDSNVQDTVSSFQINDVGGIKNLFSSYYLNGDYHLTLFSTKPLIGITSITDNNNSTRYFNRDTHGRLTDILDDNLNFIKHYYYNYR